MKDPNYSSATPYVASYIIFQKDGKMAFLLRQNTGFMDGFYMLVAGKVEDDESFTAAAIREAKEEAGVDIAAEDLKQVLTAHRQSPDSRWVDMIFVADKWTGDLYNAEPDVHAELAWLDPKNLPENVVPYVKKYLEAITAGRTYAEYGW